MEKTINKNISKIFIVIIINLIVAFAIFFGIFNMISTLYKSLIMAGSLTVFLHLVLIIFSNNILLKLNYSNELPVEYSNRINNMLENTAKKVGIPKPKIHLLKDKNINSISICKSINKSHICITKYALDNLSNDELEYMLTYQMLKILRRDTCLASISAVTLGFFIILSDKFFRSIFVAVQKRGKESESFMRLLLTTIFIVFAPVFAWIIHLFVDKNIETIIDIQTIDISHKTIPIISTLKKAIEYNSLNVMYSRACANMFFVNPLIKQKTSKKFSYHMDINKRIENIKKI